MYIKHISPTEVLAPSGSEFIVFWIDSDRYMINLFVE